MNIIFLGAPGAGKGTMAEVLSREKSIPAISTGNIIRSALKSGTEMGLRAKAYTESGGLVPDEIVIGIIKERLAEPDCRNGFILDGFPRTIPQAEALDKMGVVIDRVIDLEVPEKTIMARLSGRRVCEKCGAPYHIVNKKPKVEGVCDLCGGTLVQRRDDQPETIEARLKIYHEQTEPLKGYYGKQGRLCTVQGCDSVSDTTRAVLKAIEA
ncbi:adenylate kinase [Caproiciproducens sp. NJN-50]|uniref:adenylate kinase n=1 Tax=Acutalibacteraceae TaxID=3082771 RepID=UPI000FFE0783|nr:MULTISPECIES: adenylate kinase [Acutalibacteraceae]QAT50831.1 adenylate kinase [Caproiciproducens sp. NJN-50]